MVPEALATSQTVEYLSPSSYEILRACRLRMAYRQFRTGPSWRTPAVRLGDVCHQVLERAIASRRLWEEDWRTNIDLLWEQAITEEVGSGPEAARWPDYQLKRARLRKTADQLRRSLTTLPATAAILLEEPLTALNGRLRGRPDLIVRGPDVHRIIDYKSGSALDRQSRLIRPSYARQLQLYAVLEAEASGHWPASAHLFPLDGEPVDVRIDQGECRKLAEDALSLLDAFNASVPGPQVATVSVDTCSACSYATLCAAFWSTTNTSWASDYLAISGVILNVFWSLVGGISIEVRGEEGTVSAPAVTVRIDPSEYPVASRAQAGMTCWMVGLREEVGRGTYRLGPHGALRLAPP